MKNHKRSAGSLRTTMTTVLLGFALFLAILTPVQAQNGAARIAVAERLLTNRLMGKSGK
jgi:hypothetical protein